MSDGGEFGLRNAAKPVADRQCIQHPSGIVSVSHNLNYDLLIAARQCKSHSRLSQSHWMEEPADRLKKLRLERKYATATEAANAMGVKPPTYLGHENGTTEIPREAAIRYVKFFRSTLDYLYTGKGGPGAKHQVPVKGYVGAGAEVHPIDDHPKGRGLEMVDAPPGVSDCVAVIVRGESMYPMLQAGWLLFYRKDGETVPEECVGKLCVVEVKDGPTLVKTLRRGSKKGHWRLESWNAEPREDVALVWASRVLDIRPT